ADPPDSRLQGPQRRQEHVAHRARVAAADSRDVRVAGIAARSAVPGRLRQTQQTVYRRALIGRGLGLYAANVHQGPPPAAVISSAARSTRTAHALNSAVPDFGSETSIVNLFVVTLSGKCSVMKTIPARRPASMRAGAV